MMEACSLLSFSTTFAASSSSASTNSTKEVGEESDLVVLGMRSFCPAASSCPPVFDWWPFSLSVAGPRSRCLKSGSLTCLVGKIHYQRGDENIHVIYNCFDVYYVYAICNVYDIYDVYALSS